MSRNTMPHVLSKVLGGTVDNTRENSFVNRLRRRRFETFRRMLVELPKPVSILDVGGTQVFWEMMGCCDPSVVSVVLLNQSEESVRHSNFSAIVGDAKDLSRFERGQFDVVFSNAVMEHLGTPNNQARMATEIRRTGKNYFVQTPNRYFPVDIHYQYPFLQLAPRRWQLVLAPWTSGEIRLLTSEELSTMFPDGTLEVERVLGLTKSFMIYRFQERSTGLRETHRPKSR